MRGKRDGSWAAFSDCLITSNADDEGLSLRTPIRLNQNQKRTCGFYEAALEEKLGFVEDGMILGWVNNRGDAVDVLRQIQDRKPDSKIDKVLCQKENSYLVVQN